MIRSFVNGPWLRKPTLNYHRPPTSGPSFSSQDPCCLAQHQDVVTWESSRKRRSGYILFRGVSTARESVRKFIRPDQPSQFEKTNNRRKHLGSSAHDLRQLQFVWIV